MLGICLLPFEDHRFTQILSSINGDQRFAQKHELDASIAKTYLKFTRNSNTTNAAYGEREREKRDLLEVFSEFCR